jgi:hypothetical protein
MLSDSDRANRCLLSRRDGLHPASGRAAGGLGFANGHVLKNSVGRAAEMARPKFRGPEVTRKK